FGKSVIASSRPTLPLPSYVGETNLTNLRSIVVRVNDRGPYARDRIIDVAVKPAELLGFYGKGVTRVRVEYVGRAPIEGSDDRKLVATLREGNHAISPIQVSSSRPFAPASFDSRSSRTFDAAGIPS